MGGDGGSHLSFNSTDDPLILLVLDTTLAPYITVQGRLWEQGDGESGRGGGQEALRVDLPGTVHGVVLLHRLDLSS